MTEIKSSVIQIDYQQGSVFFSDLFGAEMLLFTNMPNAPVAISLPDDKALLQLFKSPQKGSNGTWYLDIGDATSLVINSEHSSATFNAPGVNTMAIEVIDPDQNFPVLVVQNITANGSVFEGSTGPTGATGPTNFRTASYYGYFSDASEQYAIAPSNPLKIDTFVSAVGFSVKNNAYNYPSKLTAQQTGLYNLQFSAQCVSSFAVDVWIRKNNLDIQESKRTTNQPVISWNWLIELKASEYVEIMWSTPDFDNTNLNSVLVSIHEVITTCLGMTGYIGNVGETGVAGSTGVVGPSATEWGEYIADKTGWAVVSKSLILGKDSGKVEQATGSIAIGNEAGCFYQKGIAIGYHAGKYSQMTNTIAIGYEAGITGQRMGALAIGKGAGCILQGTYGISIGYEAANSSQHTGSIAIGYQAGVSGQQMYSVAIGHQAGFIQGKYSIAIGNNTTVTQRDYSIAIGSNSANGGQSNSSIIIGGNNTGNNSGERSISIGYTAGSPTAFNSNTDYISIGSRASGGHIQGANSICIGDTSAQGDVSENAIALGAFSALSGASSNAVIIGSNSGKAAGANSLIIGHSTGDTVADNTIVLDATSSGITSGTGGVYVIPINESTGALSPLYYDTSRNEIVQNLSIAFTGTNISVVADTLEISRLSLASSGVSNFTGYTLTLPGNFGEISVTGITINTGSFVDFVINYPELATTSFVKIYNNPVKTLALVRSILVGTMTVRVYNAGSTLNSLGFRYIVYNRI